MLQEQGDILRAQYAWLKEHQGKAQGESFSRAPKWPSAHASRSKAGQEWWLNHELAGDLASDFPGLLALSAREADIIYMHDLAMPEDKLRILNVAPSLQRTRVTKVVPCITPRARMYLTRRCRLLHAVECLRLQNVWYGSERERRLLAEYGENFIVDLAGNAMEGCCLVAASRKACRQRRRSAESCRRCRRSATTVTAGIVMTIAKPTTEFHASGAGRSAGSKKRACALVWQRLCSRPPGMRGHSTLQPFRQKSSSDYRCHCSAQRTNLRCHVTQVQSGTA